MQTFILIISILGIINSFILITYSLMSKKGSRNANLFFALLIFVLTLRISKSLMIVFSEDLKEIINLFGFFVTPAIAPTYLFFSEAIINPKFKFNKKQLLHFLPVFIFTFMWIIIDQIRNEQQIWWIFYQAILLQYMIYLTIAIYNIHVKIIDKPFVKKQLNIISAFLLAIWFAYFLSGVSDSPYILGAVLYSILIYFSLIIILNKGYIINLSKSKYHNTGLGSRENKRILLELESLLKNDKVFEDNTIALTKLAKRIGTSTHALSQVINENMQMTFFELIGFYRIEKAKHLLAESNFKISEIAFEIGYNSLSSFNSAFKKSTGLTPSNYRNEKVSS